MCNVQHLGCKYYVSNENKDDILSCEIAYWMESSLNRKYYFKEPVTYTNNN